MSEFQLFKKDSAPRSYLVTSNENTYVNVEQLLLSCMYTKGQRDILPVGIK
jgi:hypothetical protein